MQPGMIPSDTRTRLVKIVISILMYLIGELVNYQIICKPRPAQAIGHRPNEASPPNRRRRDSNPHGFPVKPLPNYLSLLFPLAALIDGSRDRILGQIDASGIQTPGRVMFAPPQNHLKARSFVFADILEWVPKSAGNAFLAVEIFHFRLPDQDCTRFCCPIHSCLLYLSQ